MPPLADIPVQTAIAPSADTAVEPPLPGNPLAGRNLLQLIDSADPGVLVFQIGDQLKAADIRTMTDNILVARKVRRDIRVMLQFSQDGAEETETQFDFDVLDAAFDAFRMIDELVIVATPEIVDTMVCLMGDNAPARVTGFDADQAQEAWRYLATYPIQMAI